MHRLLQKHRFQVWSRCFPQGSIPLEVESACSSPLMLCLICTVESNATLPFLVFFKSCEKYSSENDVTSQSIYFQCICNVSMVWSKEMLCPGLYDNLQCCSSPRHNLQY